MTGDAAPGRYLLRLFVAGTAPRSLRTVESLRRICEAHLAGRYELEVIDIYQQPELAERDGVVAAPTLVRAAPAPVRRITGDLSDPGRILRGLDPSLAEARL
ncbi:circadian clock KaiB family protein [Methylobacterium sp. NEAU 140]|uniref:circadian clock KaiB family protein n=1 Tax=Methylobacterium sp. NEAU 140 TaxID=3064945 RepID=UPI0027347198|nr:circadian clock KaiB family protein [Methylobacterium sp. NEAU 140]MDP4025392.1 circadian clock KaiB family protein [Methylobacterium sp. NEAU 140]